MRPTSPAAPPPDGAAISREKLEIALKPARDRFNSLLVERILALKALRMRAAVDDFPRVALASIATIVHQISGVGATLGFCRAGELAAAVDQSLSDVRRNPAMYLDLQFEIDLQLEALLIELEILLDR